jgi:hypothetical protein
VTLANVVDDLNLSTDGHDTPIVYFLIRDDLPDSLQARTIIGSLVRQLLEWGRDTSEIDRIRKSALDIEDMRFLLRDSYSEKQRIYLIIDGLDLCSPEEQKVVAEFLRDIRAEFWVLQCASLRQKSDLVGGRVVPLPDNSLDLAEFIEADLTRCLENNILKLGDATLILKIQDSLVEGSKGMFLWVALQIRSLCSLETDEQILNALDDLPVDLSQTYLCILRRVQGTRLLYQNRILQLVASAQHPLTVEEMREALSVSPGYTDWTTAKLINDIHSTLTTCGCLIDVDEEEFTVRFVHPSVKNFVLQQLAASADDSKQRPDDVKGMAMEICHKAMADVIVTYLSLGIFDTQISTSVIPRVDGGETNLKVITAATAASKSVQNLALKLLAHRSRPNFDLAKTLVEGIGARNTYHDRKFTFVDYARRWCLKHVCATATLPLGDHIWKLLPALLERNAVGPRPEPTPQSAFIEAVTQDNEEVLNLLLRSKSQVYSDHQFVQTYRGLATTYDPLALAICKGHQRMTDQLQQFDLSLHKTLAPRDMSICSFVYKGSVQIVEGLMAQAVLEISDPEIWEESPRTQLRHVCQSGRGLLACAVWGGNTDMIRLLSSCDLLDLGSPEHHPVEEALTSNNTTALRLMLYSGKVVLGKREQEDFVQLATSLEMRDAVPKLNQFIDVVRAPIKSPYPELLDEGEYFPTDDQPQKRPHAHGIFRKHEFPSSSLRTRSF